MSTDDVLDVLPFASGLDEWLWLKQAMAEREVGWAPDASDALRAVRFVVGWIARFQVFERGYPPDSIVAWREGVEAPQTEHGGAPSILWATSRLARDSIGNPRWVVQAQLVDVPDGGRGEWGVDLHQCFADAAAERGVRLLPAAFRFSRDGTLVVDCEPGVDAEAVAGCLQRAVALANERYAERQQDGAERDRARVALEHWWRTLIEPYADVFSAVAVRSEMRADGSHFVATLSLAGDRPMVDALIAADVMRNISGLWASSGPGVVAGGIDVETWKPGDDDDHAVRADGLRRAVEEVRRQREVLRHQEVAWTEFASDIERSLGAPPSV